MGVRFAETAPDNLKAVMAHYLGFQDTDELKMFLQPENSKNDPLYQITSEFAALQKKNFGLPTASTQSLSGIYALIDDDTTATFLDIWPVEEMHQNKERVTVTWVVIMHRIIKVVGPRCFPGEPDPLGVRTYTSLPEEDVSVTKNGHTPEDWHRAYWLLKSALRIGALKSGSDGSSRKTRNRKEPAVALRVRVRAEELHLRQTSRSI